MAPSHGMTPARLDAILKQAAAKRFLVIGDLMLDEFVWGKVGRISPEAPVPVVEVPENRFTLGARPTLPVIYANLSIKWV